MDVVYRNMEEQLFHQNALIRFDYSVANERDTGMQGRSKQYADGCHSLHLFSSGREDSPHTTKKLDTMYMIYNHRLIITCFIFVNITL